MTLDEQVANSVRERRLVILEDHVKKLTKLEQMSCKHCKGVRFVGLAELYFSGKIVKQVVPCFCSYPVKLAEADCRKFWLSRAGSGGAVDGTVASLPDQSPPDPNLSPVGE